MPLRAAPVERRRNLVSTASSALAAARRPWVATARAAQPQVTVLAGQISAGVGNLAFAVLAARAYADRPAAYAAITAFLTLYLLVHLPGWALSAAGALAPDRLASQGRRVTACGVA